MSVTRTPPVRVVRDRNKFLSIVESTAHCQLDNLVCQSDNSVMRTTRKNANKCALVHKPIGLVVSCSSALTALSNARFVG